MSVSNQTGASGFPVPIGTIIAFAGAVIPPKYLLCNGGAFSGATYPILASLLGGTNTPSLVGAIIGGGTTPTVVPASVVGASSAQFPIEVANMPAFTTQLVAFSASGALNGTGQTNSSPQSGANISGSGNNAVYTNGQAMQTNVTVTGTTTGQLNAHAGTPVVASAVTIVGASPNTIAIQYIVKASY
jgi:hypothetical protein